MVRKLLLRLSGKTDEDCNVPTTFIINQAYTYGFDLIRGYFVSLTGIKRTGKLFVGKNTKILCKKKLNVGDRVRIGANCVINCFCNNGIVIGENSKIGDNSVIRCSSLQHYGEGLIIGDNSSFDANCFFGASGMIKIGNDVIAGRDIKFHAENHNYSDRNKLIREQGVFSKGISVGNNCWIGSNVVFLDGTQIGNGCVIAAGAIVSGQFGDNVVIAGVPGKILKRI